MNYALAVLLSVIVSEVVLRLDWVTVLTRLSATARKAFSVMQSPVISDHWKERVMLRYSMRMLGGTLRLSQFLLLIVVTVGLFVAISLPISADFYEFLSGFAGLIFLTITSCLYVFVRQRFRKV